MKAAATIMAVVPGSRSIFSATLRIKRPTSAEWPRKSARELSSRLTRTCSSSRNDALEIPLSDGAITVGILSAGAGAGVDRGPGRDDLPARRGERGFDSETRGGGDGGSGG